VSYKDKIICVYKITSPSGKIYIGSSVNYKKRLTQYRGTGAKAQTILYNSFLKYGIDNHVFEIVELCTRENLLERELHYGLLYEVLGEKGLNCQLPNFGDKVRNIRQETIDKMKQWKPSEETLARMKEAQIKRAKEYPMTEDIKQKLREANLGKKASDETKKKMSLKGKGRVVSEETKERMRAWKRKPVSEEVKKRISEKLKGKPLSESTKKAISIALTGRPCSQKTKENSAKANSKIILDTATGVYYDSIKEAAFYNNMKNTTLTAMLIGQNKNKTKLIYA
jgi:group I intron endonuclease